MTKFLRYQKWQHGREILKFYIKYFFFCSLGEKYLSWALNRNFPIPKCLLLYMGMCFSLLQNSPRADILIWASPLPKGVNFTPGFIFLPPLVHFSKYEYRITPGTFSSTVHSCPWDLSFSKIVRDGTPCPVPLRYVQMFILHILYWMVDCQFTTSPFSLTYLLKTIIFSRWYLNP